MGGRGARMRSGGMGGAGRLAGVLVCLGVGLLGQGAAEVACPGGAPCAVSEGIESWNRSEVLQTAVGCMKEFTVTFGSAYDTADPRSRAVRVSLCERNSAGQCVTKNPVNLTAPVIDCCSKAIQDRTCAGLTDEQAENPVGFFQCTDMRTTRIGSRVSATVRFVAPYFSDLTKDGNHELCLVATELTVTNTTVRSAPYCVPLKSQRCSACLSRGGGLNTLSKQYGTHWSQVYSSNMDIEGSPDKLEEGRLVRLGPLYLVREGETFTSIALKFGVSVNQIFFWNKHLARTPEPLDSIMAGSLICILPRTCLGNFGPNQVVFNQRELYPEIEGGAWSDPYQVDPAVFAAADTRRPEDLMMPMP